MKGNTKGKTRSYRIRQTAWIGGTFLLISLCLILNQSQVSFAAEVEITETGDVVPSSLTDPAFGNQETPSRRIRDRFSGDEIRKDGDGIQNIVPKDDDDDDNVYDDKNLIDKNEPDSSRDLDDDDDDDDDDKVLDSTDEPTTSYGLDTLPRLIYGTAWKEERTERLVYEAIRSGFRHIDTACQPKHYNEAGVGLGWTKAASELELTRSDIWIQTKFTNMSGQDRNRLPYDSNASLKEQVRQSVQKSLENLKTDYIDSLIMHGPEDGWEGIFEVWRVLESFVDQGIIKQIGISNFYDLEMIEYLYKTTKHKPAVIQNRFYSDTKFDHLIRQFCRKNNIEYQSFWTLGANRNALANPKVVSFAQEKETTPEMLMYAFVMAIGISPLDGTTNEWHMLEDISMLKKERDKVADNVVWKKEELSIMLHALGMDAHFETSLL